MIKVKNLNKFFGDFKAIDDISFEIESGNIVGFLGPNGAGKTTTMRMLAGILEPDDGEIVIDDMTFNDNEFKLKSRIGYMPENNPLYKDMLVKELLEFTLDLFSIKDKDDRAKKIEYVLNAVNIKDKYFKNVAELSKGYKQRVGLAQALINEPKLLILDEPTEGLDPNQRNEIRQLVKDIAKDVTIILSTHVMQEVEAMCNRIIIIDEGKIIADGEKDKILAMKSGNSFIKLELDGKNIESELKKINSVDVVKLGHEKNINQFNLEITDQDKYEKVIVDLSKVIANNKWVVYKLEPSKNSLEEIFYELTNQKNSK